MEDFIYYNNLFDIYGSLLTEKEQVMFKDYYHENLSLSEIADNRNITRSAVQKTIKVVIEKLNYYEDKLNVYHNSVLLSECLDIQDIGKIKSNIEKILGD